MRPQIHDALAFCRYEHDRCTRTVSISKALSEVLFRRQTLMLLELSRNIRVCRKLTEGRKKLQEQRRILTYGRTAKFLV